MAKQKSAIEIKIDELTKTHEKTSKEELIKVLAEAKVAKSEAEGDVKSLNEKLADFESGKVKKVPKPTVKVGGTEYIIKNPQIRIGGKVYTARQIKENKEKVIGKNRKEVGILDHLIDIKSGILVPKS